MPFFCTVCDKKLNPIKDKKYATIHEECMKKYVKSFSNDFSKRTTTIPKK